MHFDYQGNKLEIQRGTGGPCGGAYLELNSLEKAGSRLLMFACRQEEDDEIFVTQYEEVLPLVVVERFLQEARTQLSD